MPGDVGAAAKVLDTIFGWFTDEAGFKEMQKRRALKQKKEECRRALLDNRLDDLKRLTAELVRLSSQA
jgi:hypothetical protein